MLVTFRPGPAASSYKSSGVPMSAAHPILSLEIELSGLLEKQRGVFTQPQFCFGALILFNLTVRFFRRLRCSPSACST